MKKISTKLYLTILPITIVALVAVTVVCCYISVQSLSAEVSSHMSSEIEAATSQMTNQMETMEDITNTFATSFGGTYENSKTVEDYVYTVTQYVKDSDLIVAMGVFLEPGTYDGANTLYIVEDGANITEVDVSDIDFTSKDWYVSVKDNGGVYYTDTYIDTTLGVLMTSYVVPIYDQDGNFIGAVNTDVNMSSVQEIVNNISVGESGKATLLTTAGAYLTNEDSSKILDMNIADDTGCGLDTISDEILSGTKQVSNFTRDGKEYRLFYKTIDNYQWILMIEMSASELRAGIYALIRSAAIAGCIALFVCWLAILLQARAITSQIKKVKDMSLTMADGDFSIDVLPKKSADEVGVMSEALNQMLVSNRDVMSSIKENSGVVGSNCGVLWEAVHELEESFRNIQEAINTISGAMMDNSATTEELTASVAEVKESITNLAHKASESEEMSKEIMVRANEIEKSSTASFDNAMNLSAQYEERLRISIENSKVVNDIETMAVAISEIAEQINLLSLNASIEAARAGEHGKGFAVVATEIGNLANQTSDTVTNIQSTVDKVKESVEMLSGDSETLVKFINENVTPDYRAFVDTSKAYETDAENIQSLSSYLADIASQLKMTMDNVNLAVQNIANASQDAAEESTVITEQVDVVSKHVSEVEDISKKQKDVAHTLDGLVGRYKL